MTTAASATTDGFELVKATNLNPHRHVLADGALILRTSHQRRWFYVRGVKNGRPIRRRYRHDQMVKVQKR